MSPRIKTAVLNAVHWLRENREKHIIGDLALNENGDMCSPTDPNAECFCVLGRISKELDVGGWPDNDDEFGDFLTKTGVGLGMIYGRNDSGERDPTTGERLFACHDSDRGNPAVLDYVEELVK